MDKQEKKTTSNLDMDRFDEKVLPPVVRGAAEDETQPHLAVEYNLTGEEVRSGLQRFQKEYGRLRRWVYTGLCALIVVFNFYTMMAKGKGDGYSYLFIAVALGIAFVIWYNPIHHRNAVAKAIDAEPMTFTMHLYEQYVFIKEENGGLRIQYNNPDNKAIEMSDKFVLCVGKERIYLLPKRCLDEQQIEQARQYLSGFGDRYIDER